MVQAEPIRPSVVLVVPWFNHLELADDFFAALKAGPLREDDYCLIIDNGSEPSLWETLHMREDKPDNVLDIRLEENTGFSKACNMGLHLAGSFPDRRPAECLIWLNNDIAPKTEGWLDALLKEAEEGVLIGARMRRDSHADVDGCMFPYLDGWCVGGMIEDLLALGGFNEDLAEPAYFSDNLLSLEARLTGMRLREVPIGLLHKTGKTSDEHPLAQRAATVANYSIYVEKARAVLAAA